MNKSRAAIFAATFVVGAAVATQADATIVVGAFETGRANSLPSAVSSGRFSYDSAVPNGSVTVTVDYLGQTFLFTGGRVSVTESATFGDRFELAVANPSFREDTSIRYGGYFTLQVAGMQREQFLQNGSSLEQNFSIDVNGNDPSGVLTRGQDGGVDLRADQLTPTGGAIPFTSFSYGQITSFSISTIPVPEPASLALLGCGLLGLVAARRRTAWQHQGPRSSRVRCASARLADNPAAPSSPEMPVRVPLLVCLAVAIPAVALAQPIPVPSDSKARYTALQVTPKPGGTVEILSRRVGPAPASRCARWTAATTVSGTDLG